MKNYKELIYEIIEDGNFTNQEILELSADLLSNVYLTSGMDPKEISKMFSNIVNEKVARK